MKYEIFDEYEQPVLEELDILLEGSFLQDSTGVEISPDPGEGEDWD